MCGPVSRGVQGGRRERGPRVTEGQGRPGEGAGVGGTVGGIDRGGGGVGVGCIVVTM